VTGTAGRLGIDFGTSTTVAVVRRPFLASAKATYAKLAVR
jgi:hypothetical protein